MTLPDVLFKEWASIVLALLDGRQDVLFRKGGIAEEGRGFAILHQTFGLFPTYFHQQEAGLREAHVHLLTEAERRRPSPDEVSIECWVEVTNSRSLRNEEEVLALTARHVYRPEVLLERLHARHGKDLFVMEVIVHRIEPALRLPMREEYGGCKSWIEWTLLEEPAK